MLRDPEGIEYKVIRKLLGPTPGDVLEVGCGDGRLTGDISAFADSVVGLDPDTGSIDQARSLQGNGINLILGSGENIPLADDTVNTVVFSLSLHHHSDPGSALVEARRVLRENGRILVLEPDGRSPVNMLFKLIHNEDEAYDRAAKAVNSCGLRSTNHGSYTTIWRFEDFEVMVDYLFGYFNLEPDSEKADSMAGFLGDRRKLKPLDIEDITQYWLLNTDSGRDRTQVP